MSPKVSKQMDIMSAPQATPSLLWTISNQNKYEILKMISDEHQEDLKDVDHLGNTVLHLVILNESLLESDVVELLTVFLDRGIDVNTENKEGKAVVHFAVKRRMRNAVDLLIRSKVDVNKISSSSGTAITHDFVQDEIQKFEALSKCQVPDSSAEEIESASFAEFLVKKGFNFDLQNAAGRSALHLAIEHNLQHILRVLVKHTEKLHFYDHGYKSLLLLFFKSNASYRNMCRKDESRKFWYSGYASRHAASIVRTLLDRGISNWPRDRDSTCLQTAIKCEEDMDIIEMMVDHRLNSMETNSATNVFLEVLKYCVWWGESRTECFLKILRDLIARGVDVNGKDDGGTTHVYRAVREKNQIAVGVLSDLGADFRAKNENGANLFHALAYKGLRDPKQASDECLEALFDLIASKDCCDVNARDSANKTPLRWAVRCGNLTIARKLIESGAEVDCRDKNGRTPLHHAVYLNKNEKFAELLLQNGADPDAKDKSGVRPLVFANEDRLMSLLLNWGADMSNVVDDSFYGSGLIFQHWMKLKIAKLLPPDEYDIFEKKSRKQYRQFCEACTKEIEMLKNTYIDGCNSFYRFLHMDFDGRRNYINDKRFQNLVDSQQFKKLFPNYSIVILASYHETVRWRSLLGPAKRAWLQLTNIELTDECIERIFAYLQREDLVRIIEYDEDVLTI